MKRIIVLILNDFRLIFRDPSLRIFLGVPLLIFAIVLLLVPWLIGKYPVVAAYAPIVLMGAVVQTSIMFGFIYCMVLIHEKDLGVARVYGILPVSKPGFLLTRLLIPFIVSTLMAGILLIVQPYYTLPAAGILWVSILSGLMAPVIALLVAVFSKNKMEGMTWFKMVDLVIIIPLVVYLVPGIEPFFWIIPTHWIFQMLQLMVEGHSFLIPGAIGSGAVLMVLALLFRRFTWVHFAG